MKANSSQGFTASVADNLGIESKPLRVYSQVKYGSVARADAGRLLEISEGRL